MLLVAKALTRLAVPAGTAIAVIARAVPGLFRRPLPSFRGIALRIRLSGMVHRDRQLHADDPLDCAQLGGFRPDRHSVIAMPSAPLRPVRPMRCT